MCSLQFSGFQNGRPEWNIWLRYVQNPQKVLSVLGKNILEYQRLPAKRGHVEYSSHSFVILADIRQ
jgi:hypothetical protein